MDHNECRKNVCIICIRKASRILSETEANFIRSHLREDFQINDPDFPCGVCGGCRLKLYSKMKDHSSTVTVEPFIPDRSIKLRSTKCECLICSVATADCLTKKKKKKGRPTSVSTPVPQVIKVCSSCWTEIYPGCRHKCNPYKATINEKPRELKNASLKRKLHISLDDMCLAKKNLELSTRKTRDLGHFLRKTLGRDSVESKLEERLTFDNTRLSRYFYHD